jgi:hypothetical protein
MSAAGIQEDDSVKSDARALADPPNAFELATFGEILFAYTAVRSNTGPRHRRGFETEIFPWCGSIVNHSD